MSNRRRNTSNRRRRAKSKNRTYLANRFGCHADGTPITSEEAAKALLDLENRGLIEVTPMPDEIRKTIQDLMSDA